jgi:hypothetical protein
MHDMCGKRECGTAPSRVGFRDAGHVPSSNFGQPTPLGFFHSTVAPPHLQDWLPGDILCLLQATSLDATSTIPVHLHQFSAGPEH